MNRLLAPSVPKAFRERLKRFDPALDVVFNCERERWEIHRFSRGKWHWVLAVENEDESYRPLDRRVFKKLWEMDIIIKFGSVANYERYLDEKQKKWQDDYQKDIDHEMKWKIKDDRKLWQEAAENLRSGRINDPPQERDKKIISYPKREVSDESLECIGANNKAVV